MRRIAFQRVLPRFALCYLDTDAIQLAACDAFELFAKDRCLCHEFTSFVRKNPMTLAKLCSRVKA